MCCLRGQFDLARLTGGIALGCARGARFVDGNALEALLLG